MSKKLLITCFFPPEIGGIENYYLNLCKRLSPEEIVVLTSNNQQANNFDSKQDYKIYRTNFFGGKIPPRWKQMKKTISKIIAEEGIDKIIFGHFHPFCLLGKKFNLPYFVFNHGTDITQIKNNWWQKIALKKVYKDKNCQKFIVNSDFLASQLSSLLNQNNSKIEIINPGIDFNFLTQKITDFDNIRKSLKINEDDIILLSIGRIEPEKNLETVIKLMPKLLSQFSNLKYLIVGSGSDLERLKKIVKEYNLENNIIFTGAINSNSNIKSLYYQLSHLFITVSLKPEGFGISYLEAAATKTPVIASKFGGSSESVRDKETGFLVDPFNSKEIESAIIELITNNELREKMALAGVKWSEKFDWSHQIEKIIKTIK